MSHSKCYFSRTLVVISVVIPAFNEEKHVARCLESLFHQTYQGDYEVIVVVSGNDGTSTIAQSFGARLISQEKREIAYARQSGFEAAKGNIIASTDADTIVPTDWLEKIDHLFKQNPAAVAVAGHFQLADGPYIVRQAIKLSGVLMPAILKLAPWLWYFSGANFAVKTDVFNAVNGFNTSIEFGEDIDLCRRLRQTGRVVFEPSLLVHTSGRAFAKDKPGLNHLVNYLRLAVRTKSSRYNGPG